MMPLPEIGRSSPLRDEQKILTTAVRVISLITSKESGEVVYGCSMRCTSLGFEGAATLGCATGVGTAFFTVVVAFVVVALGAAA
jgi:hypothetical protein